MDSKIGLIIQLAGVALITLLTLFLRRSINVVALKHWTNAWLFLCFALFCLRLAFGYEEYSLQLFSLYFLNQYLFGFLLVAGCRSLTLNSEMRLREELFILPFIVTAFGLPFVVDDFALVLNIHSLILSGFFFIALLSLWRTKLNTFGWRVMLVGLSLLTLDFLQYFVLYSVRKYISFPDEYFAYNSVIDLALQTMLGFGMVIVLLEKVLTAATKANEKLRKAHEKLEVLANIDPLTTALNRHAFHGYVKQRGSENKKITGCIGFFDIDNLKAINDQYGHAQGDFVIRTVVRAIREIIRAEDLIFRWGGDEFFVIMISLDSEFAYARMKKMEQMLTNIQIDGIRQPLTVGVSHAFEDFSDLNDLEITIQKADAGMYRQKQIRKGGFENMSDPSNQARTERDVLIGRQ